jgi:hypothetical protein
MKQISFFLLAAAFTVACNSSDKKTETSTNDSTSVVSPTAATSADSTTIQWLDSTYLNLGKLNEGKEVEITYRFKNTGTKNLIIANVTAQCGCTIPEKPEQPFAPGEEGIIKAKFNGSGSGQIRKEVYVTANTSPASSHTLSFGAEIIKK